MAYLNTRAIAARAWPQVGARRACGYGKPMRRARGMGDYTLQQLCSFTTVPPDASWYQTIDWWTLCPFVSTEPWSMVGTSIANIGETPVVIPSPTAPSMNTQTPTGAAVTASTPGAVLMGNDSSGNPVYMLPSTPQQDQASTVANIMAAFNTAAAQNPPTDCSAWYSQMFNPACPSAGNGTWIVFGVGALLFGVLILGAIKK